MQHDCCSVVPTVADPSLGATEFETQSGFVPVVRARLTSKFYRVTVVQSSDFNHSRFFLI